jgi:hypothetical protein
LQNFTYNTDKLKKIRVAMEKIVSNIGFLPSTLLANHNAIPGFANFHFVENRLTAISGVTLGGIPGAGFPADRPGARKGITEAMSWLEQEIGRVTMCTSAHSLDLNCIAPFRKSLTGLCPSFQKCANT